MNKINDKKKDESICDRCKKPITGEPINGYGYDKLCSSCYDWIDDDDWLDDRDSIDAY